MNRRLLTILVCALVVSAAVSYIVYRLVGNRMNSGTPQLTALVVPTRDLEVGTLIKDADLKRGDWTGPLPKGVVLKRENAVGRGVMSALYEGEPVMENRLAPPGSGGGLAATIPNGMRACAVRVNEVVGVAGFVIPGMRVDVLIAGVPPGGNATASGPKVKTLLQNIQVLSAGANIQKDNEGKPVQVQVVNLLVTPEQAEILSLASNETRIQLVLRNPMDTQVSKPPGTVMSKLFADSESPAPVKVDAPRVQTRRIIPPPPPVVVPKPAEPTVFLIQVMNGAKQSESKFSMTEEKK
jgi:pilus assembly protein CpaB